MSWDPAQDPAYKLKQQVLADYFDRYGPFRFVIETGIYQGQGSCFQFEGRAEVVAVESDDVSAALARSGGHDVRTGDSALILPWLLASRNGPAFFWLDAHQVTEAGAPGTSPLLEELGAILAWPHAAGSVVLCDDPWMIGEPGWPNWLDLIRLQLGAVWNLDETDNVLRLTPR